MLETFLLLGVVEILAHPVRRKKVMIIARKNFCKTSFIVNRDSCFGLNERQLTVRTKIPFYGESLALSSFKRM